MWECVAMLTSALQISPRLTGSLLPDIAASTLSAEPIDLPSYDRSALAGGILHLGIGGFHRSHLALYIDDLAATGESDWSITGSGVMPHDAALAQLLDEQDTLYLLAERSNDRFSARVIGAITEVISTHVDTRDLFERMCDPNTRIVSLTVTESGYPVESHRFAATPELTADVLLEIPRTTFGLIVAALDFRRLAGSKPFTVLSCDNLPGNGNVARIAVIGVAGLRSPELADWISQNGAFPNSMVDRITPQTTDRDRAWTTETFGFVDAWPVMCEPFRQWALEDKFADGRPDFGRVGVLIADDVIVYEHMKLRLLNGSHSGLAYLAALAGIHFVHDAVLDHRIESFLRRFMRDESAPNLQSPPGIDLNEYQDSLIERFSNSAIGDTVARLCMDGTSKFPTFIVPTIEDQLQHGGPIEMVSLILAGWCRYLRGVADDGSELLLAYDPGLDRAVHAAKRSIHDPRAFLELEMVFGSSLRESSRLVDSFTRALDDLANLGALKTLEKWTAA
jgi:mannitol 2-dehydrogenase